MKLKFSVASILMLCFALCACEKDSNNDPDTSTSYIKAKFNGQEVMFSSNVHAFKSFLPNENLYSLVIDGDSEVEALNLHVYSPSDFASGGTYGNHIAGGEASEAIYAPDFTVTDSTTFYYSHYKYVAVPEIIECKITEITADHYKGTFSTDLYQDKFNNVPQKLAVTEGEFFIKR
jgi:hypothetical protein